MLSIEATIPALPNTALIFGLGAFGTVAAFLNILDVFLTFLFYLAIVFAPVGGVIAVDYLWIRRSAYHEERLARDRRVIPAALVSWATGAVVALLGANGVVSVTGIAALDAILVTAATYAVLSRFDGHEQQRASIR